MSVTCNKYRGGGNDDYPHISNVSYLYCAPEFFIGLTTSEFEALPDYTNYSGSYTCLDSSGKTDSTQSFPCASEKLVVDPTDFFQHFDIKPGYVDHPEFTVYEEYFVMSQEQMDFMITSALVLTCCVCWCLGFSANEASAK